MTEKIVNPEADTGKQVPSRPHDAGSAANETTDGLDATTEALRHAAEDTPSGALPDDSKRFRCSTAPTSHRKYRCDHGAEKARHYCRDTNGSAPSRTWSIDSLLLLVSVSVAVIAMGIVWFVFFRT